jgi:glycosyltransferase involved in cell wall biosynthesis
MKILVDGHMIGTKEGGNERYTWNLFKNLINLSSAKFKPYLLTNPKFDKDIKNTVKLENKNNLYRLLYDIPKKINQKKFDLIHSNYVSPLIKNSKIVVTLHDLSFKKYPQFYNLKDKLIFKVLLPYSLKLADAVIVPSQFSRSQSLKYYPFLKNKVFVTYEAADDCFYKINKQKARKKLKINSPFILTLNANNPKKNINRVIQAFNQLNKRVPEYRLIVVGPKNNIDQKNRNDPKIKFINHVSDSILNLLYNACRIFVYYSLYEGFGLPLLEALKANSIVIASDIPVHREVTKNKIVYADPQNPKNLFQKLYKLINNNEKAEQIRKKSYQLNKEYSWEKTAEQTVKVYQWVMKK